jgi:hypothetical protein
MLSEVVTVNLNDYHVVITCCAKLCSTRFCIHLQPKDEQMNFEMLKKSLRAPGQPTSSGLNCMTTLDRSIPIFRTVFMGAGVAAAALSIGRTADYLFAAGLLLHFTIWFEGWWRAARAH